MGTEKSTEAAESIEIAGSRGVVLKMWSDQLVFQELD